MSDLHHYTVYFIEADEGIEPQAFLCQAENFSHAEEQALNAYPQCTIVVIEKDTQ